MLNIIPKAKLSNMKDSKLHLQKINVVCDFSDFLKYELTQFIKDKTEFEIAENGYKIKFELLENSKDSEWYSIEITNENAIVSANCEEGIFRAIQTIKQLLCQDLYVCKIEDEPKNKFRSFMLDVARYFYPIDDIKTIIDYISLFKFNCLHLHLTDDQGWRFESKRYPKLTEIGSHRTHTNFNRKKEGGYYTQQQLKDLVEYCHKRFIKVIPEIDIPGHTMSALASYPELSCFDRKLKVATHWGVKFDIMCAGKDFTYQFCKDIIDELCEVFTDEYIHIGGDEVPKKRWLLCDNCNKKLNELGLSNMEQLQLYFANQMAEYINHKGKKVIMWDIPFKQNDIITPNKDIILQFWGNKNSNQICDKILNGRKVITSNSSCYYIDLPYGDISIDNSYNIDCVPGGAQNLYGYECCLWTEYVKNLKKAKFNMFPRLIAISEIYWSGENSRDYKKFLSKLDFAKDYLIRHNVNMPRRNIYNPNKLRAFFSRLWFEKRQLVWQGIYLNVDNFILNHKVKRNKNKSTY